MDEWFAKLIKRETQLAGMVISFASISLVISVLGLIGLVNFKAEEKKREISIRKVFGASVRQVLIQMNGYFMIFAFVAYTLAIPLSIWGINKWLENFAYRISLNVMDYVLAITIFTTVILLTISVQSWRTAHENPAEVLKEQ